MSQTELIQELSEQRERVIAEVQAVSKLFDGAVLSGKSSEVKRLGSLLRGLESLHFRVLSTLLREQGKKTNPEALIKDERVRLARELLDRLKADDKMNVKV